MGVPLISDDDEDANDNDDDDDANEKEDDDNDDVLDGLSSGHPDELALLSQVAAACPKVLKGSSFMASSKSNYCHHCHCIYHKQSTKALRYALMKNIRDYLGIFPKHQPL